MRNADQNVNVVKKMYADFGRGDVPAIIEVMSPDVDWDYPQSDVTPWLVHRQGREGVAAFFGEVAKGIEFQRFELKEVFGSPDGAIVVALVDVEATVKATGKPLREEDEIHLWRFGSDGKVVRFRHGVDSAKHAEAYRR